MSDFREQTIARILDERMIVIVRGVPADALLPFADALYRGGVRLMEVTFDATGRVSDEQTAAMIRALADRFDGRMLIGAGTVLSEKQVDLTAAAGGRFIISPDTRPEVIARTRAAGLVSMPGALTPTEAQGAHLCGADFVKLFPVSTLGAAYVKALCAPLSHIRFTAVGGVDDTNMAEFYRAGAVGFGIGSSIVNKKWIAEGNFDAIEEAARRYVKAAHAAAR